MIIEHRKRILVNTDPQRRCYNGCHFSSELQWTAWDWLELEVPEDKVERRLTFWRELSEYAVSQRGEEARSEFRAVEDYEVTI
jgi:hypothetical protein